MISLPRFQGFVRVFVLMCVGVFVLQEFIFGNYLSHLFGLVPSEVFNDLYIFQLVTWMFLHGGTTHLLFNMFAFWMFGSLLEERWGAAKFARFTIITGVLTGVCICVAALWDVQTYSIPTIGASGVIFAILMGVARLYPDQMVLVFFIFPMKMKYFAYLMIGIEFFALNSSSRTGISNLAHLSGALVGYVYMRISEGRRGSGGGYSSGGKKDSWFKQMRDRWHQRRMRRKLRVIRVDVRSNRVH